MIGALGSLTGGGSMPISASGGQAGPSTANGQVSAGFNTGGISFGSTNTNAIPQWAIFAGIAAVAFVLLKKK